MCLTISHRHCAVLPRVALLAVLGLSVFSSVASAQATTTQTQTAPPSTSDDPFARHAWRFEIDSEIASEAWNYNGSREEIYGLEAGFAYGLHRGLMLRTTFPVRYISQRGIDALQLSATFGFRGRVVGSARAALFWQFDLGVSFADTLAPRRGTRFNYLALGSVGGTFRLRGDIYGVTALRLLHLSNASLAGPSRNPDIEAIAIQVGVGWGF
jgi:Lipid A 3-O-deacylase (PagL)